MSDEQPLEHESENDERDDAARAPRDAVVEHNESTEGLLDEEKLREDADRVSHAIDEAKNRNP